MKHILWNQTDQIPRYWKIAFLLCWTYLIVGSSGWKWLNIYFLALPMGTWNIISLESPSPLMYHWNRLFLKSFYLVLKSVLIHLSSWANHFFDRAVWPSNLKYAIFFLFRFFCFCDYICVIFLFQTLVSFCYLLLSFSFLMTCLLLRWLFI